LTMFMIHFGDIPSLEGIKMFAEKVVPKLQRR
jgi:hypothetical protein